MSAAPGVPATRTPIAITEPPPRMSLPSGLEAEGIAGKAALDVLGGLGETLTTGVLGSAGALAGGAASYAGRFLPGGDWERAQRWADEVQKQVSTAGGLYQGAQTTTGKAIESAFNWLGQKYEPIPSGAGQATLAATGSPELAATVDATLRALPQIAAGKLIQRAAAAKTSGGAPAAAIPAPALAPDAPGGIVKAPPAAGQGVPGGFTQPEVSEAIQKMGPTVETPAAPIAQASDHAPGDLPAADQAQREAVLARVGHQNARTSAVTGNGPATMFDYDAAKAPDANGNPNAMRLQIDSELAANAGFAKKILEQTGGSSGLDQTSLANRGSVIDAPRQALQQWHDNNVRASYAAARNALGDTPVSIPSVIKAANDPLAVGGTVEGATLRTQLGSVLDKLGMVDKDGNALPITVNQAEGLRQWLTDSWTPRTSRFIGALKAGLDDDVTSAAGQDVFKAARAARVLQAQTLDHPAFDKMASRADAGNPEAIPGDVERLPSNQMAHVVNVFSNMPEGLQPLGTQALREISGHFANKVIDAGMPDAIGGAWKNSKVSDYLANNNARMSQLFTPQGMQMFSDLNQAGKITAMDKRYIGAAAQGQNLGQRGLIYALPRVGTAAGGLLGNVLAGPGGAAAGAVVGGQAAGSLATRLQEAFARKQMQGRMKALGPTAGTAAQP